MDRLLAPTCPANTCMIPHPSGVVRTPGTAVSAALSLDCDVRRVRT